MEGTITSLVRLEPNETKRMVGVFLVVYGKNKRQFKEMWNIAELWHDKVRAGHLNMIDAWLAEDRKSVV